MKSIFLTTSSVLMMLSLASCVSKTEGSKDFSEPAPASVLNASVPLKAGVYEVNLVCVSGKELPSTLPKMIYTLKADGTYTEEVSVTGPGCEDKSCDLFAMGEYKATYSTFTFTQKTALDRSGAIDSTEKTKEFLYLNKDENKGQVLLQDNAIDNACGGKMKFVLTAKKAGTF